jgi:hypothetical protein
LTPFGYYPARHAPGRWLHKTRNMAFSLIVDDFTVKYAGKQHTEHIRNTLLRSYELTTYWERKVCCGKTFQWDYKKQDMGHFHAWLCSQFHQQVAT